MVIGDLEDFEQAAQASGCDLLMTHSHGRQAAERLVEPQQHAGSKAPRQRPARRRGARARRRTPRGDAVIGGPVAQR